jgi:translocation and assembly module TamB
MQAGRALAFDLAADGRLEDFVAARPRARRRGQGGRNFAGELSARITPFATPFRRCGDPAFGDRPGGLDRRCPAGRARSARRPAAAGRCLGTGLGGRLTVVNRRPGPVDRQRLPVGRCRPTSLSTKTSCSWRISTFACPVAGVCRAAASLRDAELALRLAVSFARRECAVQQAAPHATRRPAARHASACTASDSKPSCAMRISRSTASSASIPSRSPSRRCGWSLATRNCWPAARSRWSSGKFALRGSLQNFDPSRFARLPAARLNAELEAQGSSSPQLALATALSTARTAASATKCWPAAARSISLGQRLRKADVELLAAGNRLSAKGAFGASATS